MKDIIAIFKQDLKDFIESSTKGMEIVMDSEVRALKIPRITILEESTELLVDGRLDIQVVTINLELFMKQKSTDNPLSIMRLLLSKIVCNQQAQKFQKKDFYKCKGLKQITVGPLEVDEVNQSKSVLGGFIATIC